MSVAVQEILRKIEELSEDDRLVLQSRLADMAEAEWQQEAALARPKARESNLTQEHIDKPSSRCATAHEVQIMNDPIVDEVRRVRDAHAARFKYDLDAIFQDIKEREKKSGLKFVQGVARLPLPRPAL